MRIKKLLALMVVFGMTAANISAGQTVYNLLALGNISDLTTPSALQKYPLGADVNIYDDSVKSIKTFKYVYAKTALTQYNVYQIERSSATGEEVRTGTPTSTYLNMEFGVPQIAFTANYYGFVQTAGEATVAVASNTTLGYGLRSETGTTTSSTTASAVQAAGVIGIANATSYGGGNVSAILLGARTAAQ